jgi:hypothetical protein
MDQVGEHDLSRQRNAALEPRRSSSAFSAISCLAWTRPVILAGTSIISAACCPEGNCDYAFRPNYEARHRVFTQDLNAWIGRAFNHDCLNEGNCPPETLRSGQIRFTAVDFRPWMKGCAFWFDVDPASQIVKAVGYRGSDTACSAGPLR